MSYSPNYPQPGYPSAAAHGHGSHAPPQAQGYTASAPHPQQSQGVANVVTTGQVEGAQFRVDHRDSNSMLYLRLQSGYQIKAKPGSMVAMDTTVQIKGKLKFSVKKIFTGGEVCHTSDPCLQGTHSFSYSIMVVDVGVDIHRSRGGHACS